MGKQEVSGIGFVSFQFQLFFQVIIYRGQIFFVVQWQEYLGNDYIVQNIIKDYLYIGECLIFFFGIYYVWYGYEGDV